MHPALRAAVMSNAAVWLARRKHRIDLAEQWLAELLQGAYSALRLQPEVALLEARGDFEGALRKLSETEQAMGAGYTGRAKDAFLTLMERWRSEIRQESAERAASAN